MKKKSHRFGVFVGSILTISIFALVLIASCKKEEDDNNNVDLDNCKDYTAKTVADAVSYFTGCGKTWESVDKDYVDYKSNPTIFKFKTATDLLQYNMYSVPTNDYLKNASDIFEMNGEVLMKFSPFAAKDTSYIPHDTFRINIVAKDKVELINISLKEADGTPRKGRLGVHKTYLQEDFDNPTKYTSSGGSSSGSGGSGSSSTGGSSGTCSSGYKDPTKDGQLNSWCNAAYVYRCVQKKSLSSSEVKYVCDAYEKLKYSGAPSCPHCQ
jgi:hypothetical protein